ncbi:NYN domain-containing protein [Bacillus kwashiorkori]|uniref:NYN domain-containing protein n=1 Tax=Bacillus kwashiorkori TaxID=1522318 RepID=UPI0007836D7B|nr:NYN domain-containing protein [Bacillus kwashiorkori]
MDILLVDGYNIIGAWPELRELKQKELSAARDRLIELLADYQGYTGVKVIVVFDAYYTQGTEQKYKKYNIKVIYTKEKETADEKIEKLASELKNRKTKIYVATSDYTEQRVIFGQGAFRKSARELYDEIQTIEKKINSNLKIIQEKRPAAKIQLPKEVAELFEKWRRGE